jgi:hypothetical protein
VSAQHGQDPVWRHGVARTTSAAAAGFSAQAGPQTLVGCDNIPNSRVLITAVRYTLLGPTLTFFGLGGDELGSYKRLPQAMPGSPR